MEETNNNTERGPITDKATEKKPAHIVLGMSRGCGSEAEGRTPIVIHGDGNNITVIERQYNDRTASETVKAMLDADRAQGEMVKDFVGKIIDLGAMFMPKMQAPKQEAPKAPEVVKPNAPAKPAAKSPDAKREERNANQRARRSAKKAPAKKAAKKAAPKKSSRK